MQVDVPVVLMSPLSRCILDFRFDIFDQSQSTGHNFVSSLFFLLRLRNVVHVIMSCKIIKKMIGQIKWNYGYLLCYFGSEFADTKYKIEIEISEMSESTEIKQNSNWITSLKWSVGVAEQGNKRKKRMFRVGNLDSIFDIFFFLAKMIKC